MLSCWFNISGTQRQIIVPNLRPVVRTNGRKMGSFREELVQHFVKCLAYGKTLTVMVKLIKNIYYFALKLHGSIVPHGVCCICQTDLDDSNLLTQHSF